MNDRPWLKYIVGIGFVALVFTSGIVARDWYGPGPVDPYAQLGASLSADQRELYIRELKKYDAEYQKKPNDYSVLMQIAFYREHLGDPNTAINAYIKAGEVSPNNFLSFGNLGNLYVELGDYDRAEAAYKKALANDLQKGYLYRNLIDLYNQHMSAKKAEIEKILKEGLAIPENSNSVELMIFLAAYYQDAGKKLEAIATMKQILSIDAKNTYALEGLKRLQAR